MISLLTRVAVSIKLNDMLTILGTVPGMLWGHSQRQPFLSDPAEFA